MRLRPSGRSGPVATQIDALRELSGERGLDLGAHGADARARRVGVAGIRGARRGGHPRRAAAASATPALIAGDVVEMRARDRQGEGRGDRWDLKYAAGGLIDIEFIAQYLQLVHAARACRTFSTPSTARVLDKAARLRRAGAGGCRGAAPGGAALSRSDADPAAVPARPVRSEDGRAPGCCGCWRAPPTCRISRRSTRTLPRRRRKVRASFRAHSGPSAS